MTLTAGATRVLVQNWRGLYTVPAGGLYPHQWSWDSAFIAIGLRHLSPRRAQQELESLFGAQWSDGRLPQIVFNPAHEDDYSPGSSFWQSARIHGTPGVPTAGLVQPPNHAWATWLVHCADPKESWRRHFLERAYPRLVRWHAYLTSRRLSNAGLAFIVHPWESGTDNSPLWDTPLSAIPAAEAPNEAGGGIPRPDLLHAPESDRPSNTEYGKYLYLAARYRDSGCDDNDRTHPFRVEDPLMTALMARSEYALAHIARELAIPAEHEQNGDRLTEALETLWDPALACYTARDLATDALQPYRTVSGLVPLILPLLRHRDELLATLRGEHFALGSAVLVPSHDLTAATFDASRYWRGPSWFNTSWLIAMGLAQHGHAAEARALAASMGTFAIASNFAEYLNPYTGDGRGTRRFSWTAALSLDLSRTMLTDEGEAPVETP